MKTEKINAEQAFHLCEIFLDYESSINYDVIQRDKLLDFYSKTVDDFLYNHGLKTEDDRGKKFYDRERVNGKRVSLLSIINEKRWILAKIKYGI